MNRVSKHWSAALAAALGMGVSACGAAGAPPVLVERTDSAGVEIVMNRGEDVPLDLSFEPTLVLGGADEGPEAFYGVGPGTVATDAEGRLYVLDRGNHRVVVFDSTGEHLRSFGRQGGGPGEFEWPNAVAVAPDGTVHVWAFEKRAFVRFGPDGSTLPERRIEAAVVQNSAFAALDGILALKVRDASGDEVDYEHLTLVDGEGDTTIVASIEQDKAVMRDFGCVGIMMPPLFTPSLAWAPAGDRFVVAGGVEYGIDVFDADERTASIRRDADPRPVTPEIAAEEVGEGMNVRFGGGGGCEVPPEKVVEGRGYQEYMPALDALAVSPDGTTWARRRAVGDRQAAIDLFSAGGEYVGTLAAGSPFPVAFLPDGRVVAVESDEFDVQRLVAYRVVGLDLASDDASP